MFAQLSGIVQSWAWSIVCVMLACYVQSYRNGALRHEWGHLTLHALPYYALVSMVMAGRFLDCWQASDEYVCSKQVAVGAGTLRLALGHASDCCANKACCLTLPRPV